jgi:hypothetical protein
MTLVDFHIGGIDPLGVDALLQHAVFWHAHGLGMRAQRGMTAWFQVNEQLGHIATR